MARNFLSFPSAPYQGHLSSKSFNGPRGQQKGLMVGYNVNWSAYSTAALPLGPLNPNFAVLANLNAAGPNTVSGTWTVSSVYIDNENVNFPVYVFFPSTGFAVSCPQNAAGWFQVFTLDRVALISGIGIPAADITNNVFTNVFFTDVAMVPYLDQEQQTSIGLSLSSLSISRGNLSTPGFAPSALGDQLQSSSVQIALPNFSSNFLSPQPSGFFYITCLSFRLFNASSGGAGNGSARVDLIDATSSTSLLETNFIVPSVAEPGQPEIAFMDNMNIKLDATHHYSIETVISIAGGSGFCQVNAAVTFSQF